MPTSRLGPQKFATPSEIITQDRKTLITIGGLSLYYPTLQHVAQNAGILPNGGNEKGLSIIKGFAELPPENIVYREFHPAHPDRPTASAYMLKKSLKEMTEDECTAVGQLQQHLDEAIAKYNAHVAVKNAARDTSPSR